MSDNEYGTMSDLFADDVSEDTENEEVETEEQTEEDTETEEETDEEETEEGSEEPVKKEKPKKETIPVSIAGQKFDLDQVGAQKLAEGYVELKQANVELEKDRDLVREAVEVRNLINQGIDLEENFARLGVDLNQIIIDGAKELIRRSTLSKQERDYEDMQKENQRLKKMSQEKQTKEEEEQSKKQGEQYAQYVIDTVDQAAKDIPEKYRKEIKKEVILAIEKRMRMNGNMPDEASISNAVKRVYERKRQVFELKDEPKKTKLPPKVTTNNPTPSTGKKKSSYNAADYNLLFR